MDARQVAILVALVAMIAKEHGHAMALGCVSEHFLRFGINVSGQDVQYDADTLFRNGFWIPNTPSGAPTGPATGHMPAGSSQRGCGTGGAAGSSTGPAMVGNPRACLGCSLPVEPSSTFGSEQDDEDAASGTPSPFHQWEATTPTFVTTPRGSPRSRSGSPRRDGGNPVNRADSRPNP